MADQEEKLEKFVVTDVYERPCVFNRFTDPDEFEKYRRGYGYLKPDTIPPEQEKVMQRWEQEYKDQVITFEYQHERWPNLRIHRKVNCREMPQERLEELIREPWYSISDQDRQKIDVNLKLRERLMDDGGFVSSSESMRELARFEFGEEAHGFKQLAIHYERTEHYYTQGIDPMDAMNEEMRRYHSRVEQEAGRLSEVRDRQGNRYFRETPPETLKLVEEMLTIESFGGAYDMDSAKEHELRVALTAVNGWLEKHRDKEPAEPYFQQSDALLVREYNVEAAETSGRKMRDEPPDVIFVVDPADGKLPIKRSAPHQVTYAKRMIEDGHWYTAPADKKYIDAWADETRRADHAEWSKRLSEDSDVVGVFGYYGRTFPTKEDSLAHLKSINEKIESGEFYTSPKQKEILNNWIGEKERQQNRLELSRKRDKSSQSKFSELLRQRKRDRSRKNK